VRALREVLRRGDVTVHDVVRNLHPDRRCRGRPPPARRGRGGGRCIGFGGAPVYAGETV